MIAVVIVGIAVLGCVGFIALVWAMMPRRRHFPERGWYYDPTGRYTARYYNGLVWTTHVTHLAGMDAQHLEDPAGAV